MNEPIKLENCYILTKEEYNKLKESSYKINNNALAKIKSLQEEAKIWKENAIKWKSKYDDMLGSIKSVINQFD